jgi:hypothetical protein
MDPQPMEAEVTIARLENEIQVADVDILHTVANSNPG